MCSKSGGILPAALLGLQPLMAAAAVLPASEAPASSEQGVVETILVQAERRTAPLVRVPVSATVFGRDLLEEGALLDMRDIGQLTPNLTVTSQASRTNPSLFIRGIGSIATVDPGFSQAVATYVDGVYAPFPTTALFDLLDVERVEVLRGPQGTLFGRNATAGAINIVTRAPGDSFEADLAMEAGNFDHRRAVGALNVPLGTGPASLRLSALTRRRDGFVDNAQGDDLDAEENTAVRGSVRLTPTDRLDLDFSASHEQIRDSGYAYVLEPRTFERRYDTPLDSFDDRDGSAASLRVRYDLGSVQVSSISAWQQYDSDTANPQDVLFGFPSQDLGFTLSTERERGDSWSQELLLQSVKGDRARWTVGAFLSQIDVEIDTGSAFTVASGFPFGFQTFSTPTRSRTDATAVFGDVTVALSERLRLSAGARQSWEQIAWRTGAVIDGAALPGSDLDRDTEFSAFTPRVALDLQIGDHGLAYASASRGFKAGGFTVFNAGEPPTDYDPEFVWTYEIGGKYERPDRRLFFGAAVFYNDWSDLQVFYLTTASGMTRRLVANAEGARTFGAEVDARWHPTDRLELMATLGWVDARLTEVVNPFDGRSLEDNRVPLASEWTGSASAQYTAPLPGGAALRLRADLTHAGPYFFDALNRQRQDAVTLVHLLAAVEVGRWSLGIRARNVLDEDFYRWRFESSGRDFAAPAAPRTIVGQLRASF